ncbi:MAG: AraC family transcriptional regulator [Bacteroidaceae bacterium]|nr:AraC family transcriptional regulator [Bacteroidaceae bacterium]
MHFISSSTPGSIADHLHFSDTPSFSKFFSRLSGMSPKEYRMG